MTQAASSSSSNSSISRRSSSVDLSIPLTSSSENITSVAVAVADADPSSIQQQRLRSESLPDDTTLLSLGQSVLKPILRKPNSLVTLNGTTATTDVKAKSALKVRFTEDLIMGPSAASIPKVTLPSASSSSSSSYTISLANRLQTLSIQGNVDRPPKPTRPSLSQQLAVIGQQANQLTSDIRSKYGMRPLTTSSLLSVGSGGSKQLTGGISNNVVLTMPAKRFSIGTLTCRYPSPVGKSA